MATSTVGASQLIAALTGGSGIEDAAYAQQANRILDAQNKQAALDQKVLNANLLRDQMRSRGNFERNSMDLPDMARFAALGGMGSDFNQVQQGIGHGQKNDMRDRIVKIAEEGAAARKPPEDVINMIVSALSGSMLGPNNVRVDEQALGNIAHKAAQTAKEGAHSSLYGAQAQKALAEGGGAGGIPNLEGLTGDQSSLLYKYANPKEIPVELGQNWFGDGDLRTENLPFDDPRAKATWAEMPPEQREALMEVVDNQPEFMAWRSANIANNPALKDSSYAIGEFLRLKKQGNLYQQSGKQPDASDFQAVANGEATPEEFEAFFGVPYSVARR